MSKVLNCSTVAALVHNVHQHLWLGVTRSSLQRRIERVDVAIIYGIESCLYGTVYNASTVQCEERREEKGRGLDPTSCDGGGSWLS